MPAAPGSPVAIAAVGAHGESVAMWLLAAAFLVGAALSARRRNWPNAFGLGVGVVIAVAAAIYTGMGHAVTGL